MTRRLSSLAIALLVAACATPAPEPAPPPPAPELVAAAPAPEPPPTDISTSQGAQQFAEGVKAYDNGKYKVAGQQLKAGLASGLSKADQVAAHKHLAFIACAGGQRKDCKSHFRDALAIDPAFDLTRTEAGHPVWGKAFREVKAEKPRKN